MWGFFLKEKSMICLLAGWLDFLSFRLWVGEGGRGELSAHRY